MPNTPMASTAKSMPSERSASPRVSRSCPVSRSVPTVASSRPSTTMITALSTEPRASTIGERQAEHHQAEILRRPEQQREPGERRADRRDHQRRDRAGEERGDRRDAERNAGLALLRHLVAVERGDDRGRLARDVDQDRRGRAAVLGAVVDAGEHDQRAGRVDLEGQRQQHGDGGDRPDAGQHADQGADQAAQEAEHQVVRRQRRRKADAEIADQVEHARGLSSRAATAPAGSAGRART